MKSARRRKKESRRLSESERDSGLNRDHDDHVWRASALDITLAAERPTSFISKPALSIPCSFPSRIFTEVMENLIENPNITSSHLFRADVFYDSDKDSSFSPRAWSSSSQAPTLSYNENLSDPVKSKPEEDYVASESISDFIQHMRKELRPRKVLLAGFQPRRVLVRKMIPRNPDLDRPLVQTCCFLRSVGNNDGNQTQLTNASGTVRESDSNPESSVKETNMVVYVPHVEDLKEIPWYHPGVRAVAFRYEADKEDARQRSANLDQNKSQQSLEPPDHSQETSHITDSNQGRFSIHILPFQDGDESSDSFAQHTRLDRTLKNLLYTVRKHGLGLLAGYQKQSNHDQVVSRADLQDTFTRLKQKYAKRILHEYWKEATDSTKGVFEDLGIAAFLIELWGQMYSATACTTGRSLPDNQPAKPAFPGFVDIGCGNGILPFILISEGYNGFGFDARNRKTWTAFPEHIQQHLRRMVLLPAVLDYNEQKFADLPIDFLADAFEYLSFSSTQSKDTESSARQLQVPKHPGVFTPGTFIISNHADELTPWTPLLAYLSSCPFISIPCCSHDLTGARFRYSASFLKPSKHTCSSAPELASKINQKELDLENGKTESVEKRPLNELASENAVDTKESMKNIREGEEGTQMGKQPVPSAYSTLTAFIAHLTHVVGYEAEKEMLRIPSTRNACIIGRHRRSNEKSEVSTTGKYAEIRSIVERETGKSIAQVKELWQSQAEKVLNCKDSQGKH